MHTHIYIYVYIYICKSICLPVCLSVCLSLSAYLGLCICLSIPPSIHPSIHPSSNKYVQEYGFAQMRYVHTCMNYSNIRYYIYTYTTLYPYLSYNIYIHTYYALNSCGFVSACKAMAEHPGSALELPPQDGQTWADPFLFVKKNRHTK